MVLLNYATEILRCHVSSTLLRSFGLPRPWGGPRKPARIYNGLAKVLRASSFGLGRERTLRCPAGGLLASRAAWGGGGVISSQPRRQGLHPSGGTGTSPQQRALRGQPGEWRCWPQRGYARTTRRMGVPHRLGRLCPANGNKGADWATERRPVFALMNKEKNKKTKRRRGRASRRPANHLTREARQGQKEALVAVATYNVHTRAVKGKRECGHDERILAK